MPDIKIKTSKRTEGTKKLIASKAIFDFAVDYFYKNIQIAAVENYELTNADFKSFTKFLETDTTFVTRQEGLFKKAYLSSENKDISKEYNKIKEKLFKDKINEIEKNKDIISVLLEEEILKKYYYKEGVYKHHLKNDKTIFEALNLMQNLENYNQILSGK